MASKVAPRKRVAKKVAKRPSPPKAKATGAKKPTARKAPVRKTAATKTGPTRKPVARKRPAAKKAAATTKTRVKAKTTTKAKSTGSGRGGFHRELDAHGFVPGTDSSVIVAELLKGGKDRGDINASVAKKIGGTTRNGTERNVPALVSGVLNKLLEQGYKIESTYTVVPPAKVRRKMEASK